MVSKLKIKAVEDLERAPTKEHWEAFGRFLVKSKAKYYKVFYPKKLKTKNDLLAAYVVIYDAKYVPMFRIPVTMRIGSTVQGATIYFKRLLNTNRDYKEWVA